MRSDGLDRLTYSVPQAAVVLGVSENHVRTLIKAGRIPTIPGIGRRVLISRVLLAAWVDRQQEVAS